MNFKAIEQRLRVLESRPSEEDSGGIIYVLGDLTDEQSRELDRLMIENTDHDNPDAILYAQANDDGTMSLIGAC